MIINRTNTSNSVRMLIAFTQVRCELLNMINANIENQIQFELGILNLREISASISLKNKLRSELHVSLATRLSGELMNKMRHLVHTGCDGLLLKVPAQNDN